MTGEEARHRAELRDLVAQAGITVTDLEFEALVAGRARLWSEHDRLISLHESGAIDAAEFNRRDQALDSKTLKACHSILGAERCDRLFQRVPEPYNGGGPDRSAPPENWFQRLANAVRRHFSHA